MSVVLENFDTDTYVFPPVLSIGTICNLLDQVDPTMGNVCTVKFIEIDDSFQLSLKPPWHGHIILEMVSCQRDAFSGRHLRAYSRFGRRLARLLYQIIYLQLIFCLLII